MSTLAEALAAPGTALNAAGDRKCKVARIIDQLDPDDRAAFIDALNGDEWTDERLSRLMHSRRLGISSSMLCRHRNGSCICDRPES